MKKLIFTFPTLLLAGMLSASAQQPPPAVDPFAPGPEPSGPVDLVRDGPKFISVCFETFSVELAEATSLHRSQPNDSALYKELSARVAKGKAKREGFAVVRARSGNRASMKATSEFTYPVSYLPSIGAQPSSAAATPSNPTGPAPASATSTAPAGPLPLPAAFETRDVGFTLEIEPIIGGDDKIIDLWIRPVFVSLADRSKWGSVETPVFESQSLASANTLLSDQPLLLSTLSRPPVSKVDADSAKRVWFAFVTAKIIAVYAPE